MTIQPFWAALTLNLTVEIKALILGIKKSKGKKSSKFDEDTPSITVTLAIAAVFSPSGSKKRKLTNHYEHVTLD